jgi:antitoxin VapB
MGLNIKNAEVERLAAEVARKAGESKTEAIRVALDERNQKLDQQSRNRSMEELWEYLEKEVWPHIPPDILGKGISQEEQDEILGYGPDGIPE